MVAKKIVTLTNNHSVENAKTKTKGDVDPYENIQIFNLICFWFGIYASKMSISIYGSEKVTRKNHHPG